MIVSGYWSSSIELNVDWKGQIGTIVISNPYGGGLDRFTVEVNHCYWGFFYRRNGFIDAYLYSLFYSDDLMIMVDLINEKNSEQIPFGKFYLDVPFRRYGSK